MSNFHGQLLTVVDPPSDTRVPPEALALPGQPVTPRARTGQPVTPRARNTRPPARALPRPAAYAVPGVNTLYECVGVTNHWGSLGGGHYTADCRSCDDGRWYSFDDGRVAPTAAGRLSPSAGAYVLFYWRRDVM